MTVQEQVRAALKQAMRDLSGDDGHSDPAYIVDALIALNAEPEALETTAEDRASLMPRMRRSLMAVAAFVRGTVDMEPRMHEALDALDDVEGLLRDIDRLLLDAR